MRESIVLAAGVALSPLPILVMVLLLGSRRGTANGLAFWLAWVVGLAVPTAAFVVAADRSGTADTRPLWIALAELTLGLVFLGVAVRLAATSGRGANADAPRWLDALDRSGPLRAAAFALVLSCGNPKNLALMLGAAIAIADAGTRTAELTFSTALFVAVGASTILMLLVAAAARPQATAPRLTALRRAIARHDRVLGMALGALIGAYFVFDGARSL